jgi:hypothetical protein
MEQQGLASIVMMGCMRMPGAPDTQAGFTMDSETFPLHGKSDGHRPGFAFAR